MPFLADPLTVALDHGSAARIAGEKTLLALRKLEQDYMVAGDRRLLLLLGTVLVHARTTQKEILNGYAASFVALHVRHTVAQIERSGDLAGGSWRGSPNRDLLRERAEVYRLLEETGNPDGLSVSHLPDSPATLETTPIDDAA